MMINLVARKFLAEMSLADNAVLVRQASLKFSIKRVCVVELGSWCSSSFEFEQIVLLESIKLEKRRIQILTFSQENSLK